LGDASLIKKHPFFNGIDWDNIRNIRAPYIPDKTKITANFDKFEEQDPWYQTSDKRGRE
jgi:serine/threonine kinase 38